MKYTAIMKLPYNEEKIKYRWNGYYRFKMHLYISKDMRLNIHPPETIPTQSHDTSLDPLQ